MSLRFSPPSKLRDRSRSNDRDHPADRAPPRWEREPPLYTSPARGRHGLGITGITSMGKNMGMSLGLGVPRPRSLLPILLAALAASMLTYTLLSPPSSRSFSSLSSSSTSRSDCAAPTGPVVLREYVPGPDPRLSVNVRPKLIGLGGAGKDKERIIGVEGVKVPPTNPLEKLEEDHEARKEKEREALTAAIKITERKPAVKGPPTALFRGEDLSC
jgi:hypothetical protein